MMRRPSELFRAWLEEHLAKLPPGARLPSERSLCAGQSISERTVRRILRSFHEQGKLCRVPGKGTFTPAEPTFPDIAASERTASAEDTIVQSVINAIRRGELKRGESLPSVKYMSLQFGTAQRTVGRAYRRLAQQQWIFRVGRTFRAGRFADALRFNLRKPVYLFGASPRGSAPSFRNDIMLQSYRRIEQELSSCGFLLLCEKLERWDALVKGWSMADAAPLCVAFYHTGEDELAEYLRGLRVLQKKYGSSNIRVLIDFNGGIFADPRGLHILSRGNISTTAARAVARYLADSKHHAAYLLLDESLGYDDVAGNFWNLWSMLKIRSELKYLRPDFGFRLFVKTRWAAGGVTSYLARHQATISADNVRGILSKYTPTPLEAVADEIVPIRDSREIMTRSLRPDIWIFSNLHNAAEYLQWAADNRMRIPRDISVLSLENRPEFWHLGISTCEPDWDAMGYLMAHAIIGDFPIEKTRKGFIRIGCRIVDRLTTP